MLYAIGPDGLFVFLRRIFVSDFSIVSSMVHSIVGERMRNGFKRKQRFSAEKSVTNFFDGLPIGFR